MRPSVLTAFWPLTVPIEGAIPWLYLDTEGLVTAAMGEMLPNSQAAQALPWTAPDGTPATPQVVTAAWSAVYALQGLKGSTAAMFRGVTDIRLSQDAMQACALAKLQASEPLIVAQFPDFETWPADAQFALAASMGWAQGPWFGRWPALSAACRAQDWATAAKECVLARATGTRVNRNWLDEAAFEKAAAGGDPEVLTVTLADERLGSNSTI